MYALFLFGKVNEMSKALLKNEKLINIQKLQLACWYTLHLIMYFTTITEKKFMKHLQNMFNTLFMTRLKIL